MRVVLISFVVVAWVALAQISMFRRSASAMRVTKRSDAQRETMMKMIDAMIIPVRTLLCLLSHAPPPWAHCSPILLMRIGRAYP